MKEIKDCLPEAARKHFIDLRNIRLKAETDRYQQRLTELRAQLAAKRGYEIDWDHAEAENYRDFIANFAVKNVGATSGVNINVDAACISFSWEEKEPPPLEHVFPPGKFSLQAGEDRKIRSDWRESGGESHKYRPEPEALRCVVTLDYNDVNQHKHGQQFCMESNGAPTVKGEVLPLYKCPEEEKIKLRPSF